MNDVRLAVLAGPGDERRKWYRIPIEKNAEIDNYDVKIVNMSEKNIGFLSDVELDLNERRKILITQEDSKVSLTYRITRAAQADSESTGFRKFYGGERLS